MDEYKMLFEKGCFLANWIDDESAQTDVPKISKAYSNQTKDLQTLLSELDEIKEHIQEVREREWQLDRLLYFHNNNLSRQ